MGRETSQTELISFSEHTTPQRTAARQNSKLQNMRASQTGHDPFSSHERGPRGLLLRAVHETRVLFSEQEQEEGTTALPLTLCVELPCALPPMFRGSMVLLKR